MTFRFSVRGVVENRKARTCVYYVPFSSRFTLRESVKDFFLRSLENVCKNGAD